MSRIQITDVQNSIILCKDAKLKFLPNIGNTICIEENLYKVVGVNHDIISIVSDASASVYIGVIPCVNVFDTEGELRCQ